jgi:hypothetical protein
MIEDKVEAAAIAIENRVEASFDDEIEPAMLPVVFADQKSGTQHWGQRQRDDHRHQNAGHDGDGEFMEQAADDAAHQQ